MVVVVGGRGKRKERYQDANNKKSGEFCGHFLVVGVNGEKELRDSARNVSSFGKFTSEFFTLELVRGRND